MTSTVARPIDDVPIEELLRFGVWEFVPESAERDETWVQPVLSLPVSSLDGRFVALNVRLADGMYRPAILGSIDLHDPVRTQHFRGLTLVDDTGRSFHLARYHDFDYESRGPRALAEFLGLPFSAVFPITYDLTGLVLGPASSIMGEIPAEPEVRLSRAELINMAVS